jgi:hypothetical protein
VISFFRLIANSISASGVFCVFLMNPCKSTMRPSQMQNSTRAMRPSVMSLRTSHSPPAEWSAQRHSDGPGELYILDVLADDLAIVIAERLEPFASWLSAGRQLIEGGRQSLHGLS